MKKKYEVIGIVGEGAYGIVYKCKNKETDKFVAIKKFKETEDELVQKTMKRELKMLQQLKHENIVEFQESFTSKGNLFLVFEYCEKNLLEVLEESPDGLSPKLIKSFIYQMCKAIAYMHKNNMIHRDIKPENLLIDENLNLKLCDFGFARKVKLNKNNNNINEMTDYVATRWYRSPELLLSGGIYGPDVDYWAVGCIMGELADGNPMFPGENETDQINCIINVLGNLPEELVNMFYRNPIYEGKELKHVSKVETLERRYIDKLGPTAIDFMKGLLQLDPKKRLNSETVFKHKYFACFMKDEKERQKINEILGVKENKDNNIVNNSKENNIKTVTGTKNEKNNAIIVNKSLNDKNKSNPSIIDTNNKIKTNLNRNVNSLPKEQTETKVINNTTNINIINYNNINNPPNNIIEIHNNSINNNINNINSNVSSNNNSNSISKNKNIKSIKNNPNSNNILINNSMIIKVSSNNSNPKDNKIELNNTTSQNGIKLKSFINPNFSNNIKKSINMNNSVYNFPIGNKKSLSMNKFIKLNEYQNMSLLSNFPNLMTISLSQGKNNKVNKINNNLNSINNINNISSTFYSLKNNGNSNSNNIIPKKLTSFNNNGNNSLEKNKKNNKYNYISLANANANNYLGGYKTFFNKNNSNDKYNYDINTNYFKDEIKKYNSSPIGNYYNNVIDENDEYPNSNESNINIKSFYNNNKNNKKKNYFNDKKDGKLMTKYKDSKFLGKSNGKFGIKKNLNGYGTLYNYGYGKKNNVELPQLIQIYNKNTVNKSNNNHYYGLSYNKKY